MYYASSMLVCCGRW